MEELNADYFIPREVVLKRVLRCGRWVEREDTKGGGWHGEEVGVYAVYAE